MNFYINDARALARVTCRAALLFGACSAFAQPYAPAPVEYYRLVPGFVRETMNEHGMAAGSGFSTPNPWGAYTAYLLSTNAKGQRTWRIENYLPNPGGGTAQGSTMYLFEGSSRALLVDTAQNTQDVPGKNDLKTVVRYLLGHTNDGGVKSNPVDFVVANTHSHGDHIGKNPDMSDRTVYYPDLDWPRNAPANYVPIREGGGTTAHGAAASEIDLGHRTVYPIDIHAHTPGSTGYLDKENQMIATGDAIGSAFVWAFFAPLTEYAASVHHLQALIRPFEHLAVLPAHFYQNALDQRAKPPMNGKPVDTQYVDDQVVDADGILSGAVIGEPYLFNRGTVWAKVKSAQICYSLASLYPGGVSGTNGDKTASHAVAIPGEIWAAAPNANPRYAKLNNIKTRFYMIRDYADQSMYLIVGSAKALLVGTGSGTPAIAPFVAKLAGRVPVEVIVTSDDLGQTGGLAEFASNKVYLPRGVTAPAVLKNVSAVGPGDMISLGTDSAGRPATIQVFPLGGHSTSGITLLDVSDRLLLSGDALGTQNPDAGLVLHDTLSGFSDALKAWRAQTDGKYDLVYTAHNYQWYTDSAYVDQLESAVKAGIAGGTAALIDSTRMPGYKLIKSSGGPDVVASIVLPEAGEKR